MLPLRTGIQGSPRTSSGRSVQPLLIINLRRLCVNGFKPHCEVKFRLGARYSAPKPREKHPTARGSAAPLFEWPWNWRGLAAALLLAVLIVWRLAPAWPWNGEQFLATEL